MNTSMEVIHHGVIIGRQWRGHECGTPSAEAPLAGTRAKKMERRLLFRSGGRWKPANGVMKRGWGWGVRRRRDEKKRIGDKVSISATDSMIKTDIRASAHCCASDSLETIICRDAMDTVLSGCSEDTHRNAGSGEGD